MVRRTSVVGRIITARWYAEPASLDASSPLVGTPGWRRWTQHHRRTVRWAGVDGLNITAGLYAGPTSMEHHHCRMVRWAGIEGHIITAR
jgi:hypothetical protein